MKDNKEQMMGFLHSYVKKIITLGAHVAFALFVFESAYAAEVSRAIPGKASVVAQQSETETTADENNIKSVSQRSATPVVARTAAVASRTATNATPRESLNETVRQVGRSSRTEAASLNSSAPVRRAGISLRPTTAEVGGRATIVGTNIQTGSNMSSENRRLTSRAATVGPSGVTPTSSGTDIESSNNITESCIAQYTDCMDQFCSVIDANQKRCACSDRLSSYSKVESAVKEANTQLNDVAQRIRYVGLSADEITAIMSATEAEEALENTKDTTESRNMLDEIEKLIKSPETATSSSSSTSLDLDISFDASADPADMFSLSDSSSDSFSNLRGTDLYNSAKKRCQSILTSCKTKGADMSQVQGRYDIAIDKDCISYETGLEKMNQTLRTNVRSATQMLQKARLAVLDNHNTYDAKGCVGALEECMQDDMVCGSDYSKCLDPTKRYIDENGEVVLGQNISKIRDMMENFDNSAIDSTFIGNAWSMSSITNCDISPNNNGKCIVKYLLGKIGMTDSTSSGLCRPVLEKCQQQTYDSNGRYNSKNSIVVNYIQRAMTNIRADQEKIISDYASSCMADIATCYSKQVTQINSWSSNANVQNVYSVLKGACRNVALTCSYAVFAADDTIDGCPTAQLAAPNDAATASDSLRQGVCIENISDIFYQSMLCPDYSVWMPTVTGVTTTLGTMYPFTGTATNVYVNERCVCQAGYGVDDGECIQCPTGYEFNSACNYANESVGCPIIGCGCPSTTPYWDNEDEECVSACSTGVDVNPNTNVCCPSSTPSWDSVTEVCE